LNKLDRALGIHLPRNKKKWGFHFHFIYCIIFYLNTNQIIYQFF
jgi:hypothetical protein